MSSVPRPRACRAALGLLLLAVACGEQRRAPAAPPARISADAVEAELEALVGGSAPGAPPAEPAPAAAPAAPVAELTVGARLLDELAHPLAGATLEWLERAADGRMLTRHEALSGRDGSVWLRLARDELPRMEPLWLAAGGPGRMRHLLEIERARWEGVPLLSLNELSLRAGGSVAGRVLDAAERPLANAWVGLGPELGALDDKQRAAARLWPLLADLGQGAVPPLTLTDAEGRFVLAGVPCGAFQLVAAWLASGETPRLPDREAGVNVRAGEETRVRDLVLAEPRPEEVLAGVVLDSEGQPRAGASFALVWDGVGYPGFARSSAEGRFAILAPAGSTFDLDVRCPDGRGLRFPGVSAGRNDLVLRLPPAPGR